MLENDPLNKANMVNALKLALVDGSGSPEWVWLSDIKTRLLNAKISMKRSELQGWLDSLVDVGKLQAKTEGNRAMYRLADECATETEPSISEAESAVTDESRPPRVLPKWYLLVRQDYEHQIAELKRQLSQSEKTTMEERTLALAQYGDPKELATIKERVALAPYGATLDERGRAMVAQIAYMLDWNPFFDMHAFENRGKLVIMPDYKKLLSMAREQQRINYKERPMTSKERESLGVKENEIGFVVEITEVDTFLDYAKAGVAEQYSPVMGYGIWRPGDNVPGTWTPEMVAKKRGLRHGLSQLASYKIVSDRFRAALQGAGFTVSDEDDEGFTVELPANTDSVAFWDDNPQRQRFWIEMGKMGYNKKAEVATLLKFNISDPSKSENWRGEMAKFPNLENLLAYARVCAENEKPEAPDVIDGEVIEETEAQ